MKSVFIAGSRKFYEDIELYLDILTEAQVKASIAGKHRRSKDTLESEKAALLSAFEKIDKSNVVYVYSQDGYIGKTVAMEIAYAYSKKKEIISSHKIEELSARGLVSQIMKPADLIKYCKR